MSSVRAFVHQLDNKGLLHQLTGRSHNGVGVQPERVDLSVSQSVIWKDTKSRTWAGPYSVELQRQTCRHQGGRSFQFLKEDKTIAICMFHNVSERRETIRANKYLIVFAHISQPQV